MNYFYFNECIPQTESYEQYTKCLERSLKEYYTLKKKHRSIDGIVTEKQPSDIVLNGAFTLKECILSINDREMKRLALIAFGKYPIESFMENEYTERLIQKNYRIEAGGKSYDALNLAMTSLCGGISFTLALHEDLKRHPLILNGEEEDVINLDNLYGSPENTSCLSKAISEREIENGTNLIKLEFFLGSCKFSEKFKKDFKEFSYPIQQSIQIHFQKAKNRNLVSPYCADKKIIKDVTPDNALSGSKVYELRIYTPAAIRVYFREGSDCTYIASIGKKSASAHQSGDITLANELLDKLMENES